MIIVGMSVVATVVVLQYHHHDPNGGNMPKWVSPPNGSSQLRPRPSLTSVLAAGSSLLSSICSATWATRCQLPAFK